MSECYTAALLAGTTLFVAWAIGSIVGSVLGAWLTSWFENRAIRKDRERIEQLMAETEAQREQYRMRTKE
ncbi:DUF1049 domain-containing protein [Arcanobacterium wilhelmae]|uniref:DUF1049 domain-containing protein n=1 Tax=Arcanobacterium wilhelmae TaxID=1803177 RepID=UPI002414E94B|nr:DUF1049 domain-containing protein [Arcanobacterium wilhelmae]WFN90845.1 DUF1049 domain-containing protein [Arcanobacterium wilhelmae]